MLINFQNIIHNQKRFWYNKAKECLYDVDIKNIQYGNQYEFRKLTYINEAGSPKIKQIEYYQEEENNVAIIDEMSYYNLGKFDFKNWQYDCLNKNEIDEKYRVIKKANICETEEKYQFSQDKADSYQTIYHDKKKEYLKKYDLFRNYVEWESDKYNKVNYTYDEAERLIKKTNNKNYEENYEYDNENQITNIIFGNKDKNTSHQIEYDEKGRIKKVTSGNINYEFTYSDQDELIKIASNDQVILQRTYQYEKDRTIIEEVNSNKRTYRYVYDIYDNLVEISRKTIDGYKIINYNIYTKENLDYYENDVTPYDNQFEKLPTNLLKKVIYEQDGEKYSRNYEYDNNQRVILQNDSGINITYSYPSILADDGHRLLNTVIKNTKINGIELLGEIDCETYTTDYVGPNQYVHSFKKTREIKKGKAEINDKNIDYIEELYSDKLNRLPTISVSKCERTETGSVYNFTYDNTYEYKQIDGLESDYVTKEIFELKDKSFTILLRKEIAYDYDEIGQVTSYKEDTSTNTTKTYKYDILNQIIEETNPNEKKQYQYDENGNIIEKRLVNIKTNQTAKVTTYKYDQNKIISINNNTVNNDDLGRPIKYIDENNNQIEITYDEDGNLSKFVKGNTETNFKYTSDGVRISKESNNIKHQYCIMNNQIIKEDIIINNVKNELIYLYGNSGLIGFEYNNKSYFYRRNMLNEIIGIYQDATLVARYEYDAWGNHQVFDANGNINNDSNFIGNINSFRYKGYYYDVETGLYFVSTRFYSPELCRWLTPDSIEYLDLESINGLNLYCYCYNNPVMYTDPRGHFAISALIIGAIIGALIGFGVAAYIDYQDDGEIFNGSVEWYDYLGATVLGGIIGTVLGTFASMSFSLTIPTGFALVQTSSGTLMLVATGSMTLTVTGAQILGVAGLLGSTYMFAKGNGPRIGHNQYENKQFNSLCNKYKLTKKQRRILHDYISGQNYSYHEIEQIIKELFFS